MTFVAHGASHADSVDAAFTPPPSPPAWKWLGSRIATFCLAEIQKIRHDRTELLTRAIQPALWLLIFGETFDRLHATFTVAKRPPGYRPIDHDWMFDDPELFAQHLSDLGLRALPAT